MTPIDPGPALDAFSQGLVLGIGVAFFIFATLVAVALFRRLLGV